MIKERKIKAVPKSYMDWLDCFDILQHRAADKEELALLSCGECAASEGSVEYLETQLIKTVNIMIRRSICAFNKELELYTMYNEYENIHRLFIALANKFRACMFFMPLEFMSIKFRKELQASVINETGRFWRMMINSMYSQCTEQNNSSLEDELYMIKRIKLFG